jgi:hypothetical protein
MERDPVARLQPVLRFLSKSYAAVIGPVGEKEVAELRGLAESDAERSMNPKALAHIVAERECARLPKTRPNSQ